MSDPNRPRPAFAPWDRRQIPGIFDVEESARRVGNYKWVEMRLFEVLGGWVATVPELDVTLLYLVGVAFAAWFLDRTWGILAAVVSAGLWLFQDFASSSAFTMSVPVWPM